MNQLKPQKINNLKKNNNKKKMVIPKKNSNNKNYKRQNGIIKSLEKETQSISLHINSIFRDNYYLTSSTDFTYTLPVNCENIKSLKLTSISLPNTWYLFSSEKGNNRFTIEFFQRNDQGERTSGETNIYQIVIPDGNYTSEQLTRYLNTTYFQDYREGETVFDQNEKRLRNIRFQIDENSLKSSFHLLDTTGVSDATNLSFDINFIDENNNSLIHSSGWILGFRKAKYKNIFKKIQSESLYDGGGDRYIYFCLDDYQLNKTDNNIVCLDNTYMEKNILAKLNISTNSFGIQIEDNPDNGFIHTKTRNYNGLVDIKKIKVKLIDMYGNIINLNLMDFSFTLELEKLYQNIL